MQDYFFMLFYGVLVVQDFKYADLIYHFAFEDFLLRNESFIVKYRSIVNKWFEDNLSGIMGFIKANIVGIFKALSMCLPASVQPFVLPFFESLSNYQKKAEFTDTTSEVSDAYVIQKEK